MVTHARPDTQNFKRDGREWKSCEKGALFLLTRLSLRKGYKKFTVVTGKEFISRDLLFKNVTILEPSVFPYMQFSQKEKQKAWFGNHGTCEKIATCNDIFRKLELAKFGTPPYLEPAIKPPVDNIVFVSSSLY